jgi:hypothetical protein
MNQEDAMLRSPEFLGFSMVRRNSRRRLVAVTYAILLALLAVTTVVSPSLPRPIGGRFPGAIWLLFVVCSPMSGLIFGKLAKDMVPFQMRGGEMTGLGLTPQPGRSEADLDERELAVRNAAYFTAYRAVVVYFVFAGVAFIYSFELSASTARLLRLWLIMPLLGMIFSLPQALILWREPDVPEETRV